MTMHTLPLEGRERDIVQAHFVPLNRITRGYRLVTERGAEQMLEGAV